MRVRGSTTPGRRARGVVVATVAATLLVPGAAVAAEPAMPPGALPVTGPVQLPERLRDLLRRLPALRATDLGVESSPGSVVMISTTGIVAGTAARDSWDDFQAYRWDDGALAAFPAEPGTRTQAQAVNASGQVLVNAWRDDGGPFPYLWHPDGSVEALPIGVESAYASAVNDSGTVVGATRLPTPAPGSEGDTAVMWRDGELHDLAPGGFDALARDVNERGVVVGLTHRPAVDNTGWVWRDGVVTDLPTPAGFADTTADQVNDRGDVRGGIRIPDVSRSTHVGAVWFGGTALRHLGASPGWLSDLNEKGLAVGTVWRDAEDPFVGDAVTMDRHRVTRLATTSGGPSAALAVDDLGVVVGHEVRGGRTQAVAWVLGVPVPLGAPAGTSGVVASSATGVDERGRVVGWVRLRTDPTVDRAAVWDLVPTRRQVEAWLAGRR